MCIRDRSWDADPTPFLNYYTVYRSTVSGTNDPGNYAAITNVLSPEYLDQGLINATSYYYSVTAVGTNGTPVESDFSDELVMIPIEKSTNTVLLMNYTADDASSMALSNGNVVVSWTNQVGDGSTYPAESVADGVLYPSGNLSATGLPGLDFTTNGTRFRLMGSVQSDNLLDTTGDSSGFVVMMAIRPEGLNTQQDILGNTSTVSQGFGIRWTGAEFQTWLAGTMPLPTTATTGDTVVVSYRYDARTFDATAWESASGNSVTQKRNPVDY